MVVQSLTNDLKNINKRKILIDVAKKLNCKFIFTPEISTDIASQLLSNVALGRGSHIPLDTGFCDTRDEHVTILRPLRVFDIKELALYNYFNNLEPVTIPENVKDAQKSVQSLIENFVTKLQSDFPATVTTVLKTGDKLGMSNDKTENYRICYICKGPISVSSQSLTSEKAIKVSQKISRESIQLTNGYMFDGVDESNKKTCFSCSNIEPFLIT
ncbi:hypothetical protein HHI36_007205 [Cryptolaemus montrouzieri]|uniref:Cytoplasmic tRNA 2-thiolation protein 2 n=1 Tax=Cryptolaemus montrouzieri TaxID=559131 RepID=A0ABD2MPP8_9CUCU